MHCRYIFVCENGRNLGVFSVWNSFAQKVGRVIFFDKFQVCKCLTWHCQKVREFLRKYIQFWVVFWKHLTTPGKKSRPPVATNINSGSENSFKQCEHWTVHTHSVTIEKRSAASISGGMFDNNNHNDYYDFHLQNHHHQQQRKSALTKQTCLSLTQPAAAGPFQLISYQFCVKSSKTLVTGSD